ncbi:MAG: hypothetical protein SO142_04075, partial [Prevotella sp.]|nr:hypothetical protein [Prevotella sp.]
YCQDIKKRPPRWWKTVRIVAWQYVLRRHCVCFAASSSLSCVPRQYLLQAHFDYFATPGMCVLGMDSRNTLQHNDIRKRRKSADFMARQAAAVFTGVFRVKRCNMMLTVVKIVRGAGIGMGIGMPHTARRLQKKR